MLLRTSAIYMLANAISAVIGFALVMTLTRLLPPDAYGIYVIANSLAYILVALMFTWLRQSLLRFESEGGTTDLRLTTLVGYGATLFVLPLAYLGLRTGFNTPPLEALGTVGLAAAIAFYELTQEIARARQKPWRFLGAVAVRSGSAFCAAVLAAKLGYGGLGLIAAAAFGHAVACVVLARWTWEGPLKAFDRAHLAQFIAFGAPITFAGIFYAIHASLDRLMVASTLGAEAAGQYGAAADFVRQAINLPAVAASAAIAPMAVHALKHEGVEATRRHLEQGLVLLAAIVGPAAVGLAVTAPHAAAVVFGEAYRPAASQLIPFLALAWFGHALAQHYIHLSFNLASKPKLYIVQGAATLGAGIAMIPLGASVHGLLGAAIGLMASEWFGLAVGAMLTRRAHPLPLPWSPLLRVAIALGVMTLSIKAAQSSLGPPAFLSAAALIAVGGIAYVTCLIALDVLGVRRLMLSAFCRKGARHVA